MERSTWNLLATGDHIKTSRGKVFEVTKVVPATPVHRLTLRGEGKVFVSADHAVYDVYEPVVTQRVKPVRHALRDDSIVEMVRVTPAFTIVAALAILLIFSLLGMILYGAMTRSAFGDPEGAAIELSDGTVTVMQR